MGNKFFTVTLSGGATTNTEILMPTEGLLHSIRLSKNSQSASPVVTIKKDPSGEVVLNGVTVSADTSYYPEAEIQTNAAVATGLRTKYALAGFRLVITVTGGDSAGVVSGYVEWL